MRPVILALGFVLIGATDWQLQIPSAGLDICAKSHSDCEAARMAIEKDWFLQGIVSSGTATVCRPRPGCFTPDSEVIKGFNDR